MDSTGVAELLVMNAPFIIIHKNESVPISNEFQNSFFFKFKEKNVVLFKILPSQQFHT